MFKFEFISHKVIAAFFIGVVSLMCFKCHSKGPKNTALDFSQHKVRLSKPTDFGGVQLNLFSANRSSNVDFSSNQSMIESHNYSRLEFRPEISLFTSESPSRIPNSFGSSGQKGASNRYKNTIPAVYRLTLKGYSIVEYSNYVTETWSLDKVKNRTISKPTIMFSITKQF